LSSRRPSPELWGRIASCWPIFNRPFRRLHVSASRPIGNRPAGCNPAPPPLPPDQLLRPLVVFDQLFRDPLRHIRTGPPELAALAFLRCGPDHVAILVHQPDRADRLMLALLAVARFVFADSNSPIGTAAVGRARAPVRADIGVRIDALA